MSADELRLRLLDFIKEDLDLDAHIQGKRLVVEDRIIILVTPAKGLT